jgi:hypothetical protein
MPALSHAALCGSTNKKRAPAARRPRQGAWSIPAADLYGDHPFRVWSWFLVACIAIVTSLFGVAVFRKNPFFRVSIGEGKGTLRARVSWGG